jgi:hypothetical protein
VDGPFFASISFSAEITSSWICGLGPFRWEVDALPAAGAVVGVVVDAEDALKIEAFTTAGFR